MNRMSTSRWSPFVILIVAGLTAASGCLVSLDGYELATDAGDGGGAGTNAAGEDGGVTTDGSAGVGGNSGDGGAGGIGGDGGSSGTGGDGGAGGAGGAGGSGGSAGFDGGDCDGLDCDLKVPPEGNRDCPQTGTTGNCGSGTTCRIATPTGGRCDAYNAPGCKSEAGDSCSASSDCCGNRTCFRGQCTFSCDWPDPRGDCEFNACLFVGNNTRGVCWPPY